MANQYQGTDDTGITYFVQANTEDVAGDKLDALVQGNVKIKNVRLCMNSDFTLFDTTAQRQFQILTKQGWIFYGTATSRKAFQLKFQAALAAPTGNFVGKTYLDCFEIPQAKFYFQQADDFFTFSNAHWGQPNPDFTEANIVEGVQRAKRMQSRYIRDNYTTAGGQAMQPYEGINGRLMKAKAYAATQGIGYILTLSLTGSTSSSPATLGPNWNATIPTSQGWINPELDAINTDHDIKGFNVQTLHPDVNIWMIGSEIDNLNQQLKVKSGAGAKPLAEPTVINGVRVYTSGANSTGGVTIDARWYPPAIAATAGYIKGIRRANPNAIIMMNTSSMHYGVQETIIRDAAKYYGQRVNVMTADWYNTEETGTDSSKVFNKTSNVPMRGKAIEYLYQKFVLSGLCDRVGFTEMGWKDGFNTFGHTELTYYRDVIFKQYAFDPRCYCAGTYEIFDEPNKVSNSPFELTLGYSEALMAQTETMQIYPKGEFVNPYINS